MITAAFPDPSKPTFVLLAAALGAFLGATVSRIRRLDRDALRVNVENWAYFFTVAALLVYILVLVIEFP